MASVNSDFSKKRLEEDEETTVGEAQERIQFDIEDPSRKRSNKPPLNRRSSIFQIKEKIAPDNVLPGVYKTVSHQIDANSQIDYSQSRKHDNSEPPLVDYTWNVEPIDQIVATLSSDAANGLTTSIANEHAKKYGENVQSKPPSNLLKKLFIYFFGGFGILLFAGGILCIVSWKPLGSPPAVANLILGIVLLVVFLSQALFNFWQDFSSSKVMDSIYDMIPLDSHVIRDGQSIIIPAKGLVPGDLISIQSGDKVPADIRIFQNSNDLMLDKSVLTGESKPCFTHSNPDSLYSSNYLESNCIAMQGTSCVSGNGLGIVVSIGDATVFGQIAKMSSKPKKGLTPVQIEILRFVILTVIIIISLVVLVIILWAAWLRKDYPNWINVPTLIVDIVSVAVAFMPEGLPIALTTCLIITAGAMRKNKILCKSLSVVETLGSVSVLCSDKTGTLTKNQMFVTNVYCNKKESELSEEKFDEGLDTLYTVAGLCNDSTSGSNLSGNATDQATFKFSEGFSLKNELSAKWFKRSELSFNSKNKFMVKLLEATSQTGWELIGLNGDPSDHYLMAIKGAPDILLNKCSLTTEAGILEPLSDEYKQNISSVQTNWAKNGRRVILLAAKVIPKETFSEQILTDSLKSTEIITDMMNEQSPELIFVGMIGLCDPPRDGIRDTTESLKSAGIKIVMITGDFELTAVSIGKLCGIVSDNEGVDNIGDLDKQYYVDQKAKELPNLENEIDRAIAISGHDMNFLNDNQWDQLTNYKEIIFARTTPEQKLMIVNQFQKRKHIVGMIGDGINDAPSLRAADVGISLKDGCDIAKEASDLVLLESVHAIVEALKFGRLVFENLKKTLAYLLPAGTYSELWPILLNVIFGLPQVLSSFNMIIICCLTDCLGAITLAFEPSEKNLLFKKPRILSKERLVDYRLILHSYFIVGTFYTFTSMLVAFLNFQRHGIPFSKLTLSYGATDNLPNFEDISSMSSSIYFVNLVIMQFFNLLSIRTRYLSIFQQNPFKNHYMFMAIPAALGITFIINYIPAIQKNLSTGQVPVEYYFIAVGFGCIVFLYDELRKMYVRKHPQSFVAKLSW
ncbi:hypothetical protein HYPBUDRAFT_152365 [Hyphopichia burtonii NRRL Y-1933]|uniref:Cation-transporting P-type ATPase N-terminal domain-containing protein n=1 Tax=Hyphopichia burtonii NRRL Y-1933 TaxID=984485 RepID=A0A1E4RJF3_9ASCO|nr:hypothetical protein HYPBUDRAFT_152365 [Hyphopichia burtonii NRRL Y-1933]ODV67407.1 hypothetical protein HYPBUDRAFT_152365 [Hyphopichia burtonii NRRL Y-1933]